MGERAKALRDVELHVPPKLPRQVLDTARLWDGERLYDAPWYPVVRATPGGWRALRPFASLPAMGFDHRRIRLPGGGGDGQRGGWRRGSESGRGFASGDIRRSAARP